MNSPVKAAAIILKFAAIAILSAFAVLIANHYYQLNNYAQDLKSKLNIIVFIDQKSEDDAKVCNDIEALELVSIDEYVDSKDVYTKAIEKNPFLKDISVPGDRNSFQSYIKISPLELPKEEYLVIIRNSISDIQYVDEIVFDPEPFKEYVETVNILSLYRQIGLVFAIIISILFIAQSVLFIFETKGNIKKLFVNIIAYLIASSVGFLCVWSICLFLQYVLVIDEIAAFYIIPLTAAFGIIFKD